MNTAMETNKTNEKPTHRPIRKVEGSENALFAKAEKAIADCNAFLKSREAQL